MTQIPLNDSPATEQAIRDGAGDGSRVEGAPGERETDMGRVVYTQRYREIGTEKEICRERQMGEQINTEREGGMGGKERGKRRDKWTRRGGDHRSG